MGEIILTVTSFNVSKCALWGKLGENKVMIALPQREFDWFLVETNWKKEFTDDNEIEDGQRVKLRNVEFAAGKTMWHIMANAIELV